MNFRFRTTLMFAFFAAAQSFAHATVLEGRQGFWMGDMKIPNGPTLKMGAEVFQRADGSQWASVSSPDQDAYDIPVTSIKAAGDSADLDMGFAKLRMKWVGDRFVGEFMQGEDAFAFDMQKVSAFPKKSRPQTPVAPFPYEDQSLAIASADGTVLGATLSVPKGAVRPNVVILVHGSGPGTRNQNLAGHENFAVLADYLARNGVAVLRYDKRGISRSTGNYEQHTNAQLIDDLHAIAKSIKGRQDFNRVGLLGHSEGPGLAAAVAARDRASVDFVISLGGIGVTGLELMYLQDRIAAIDNGASEAEANRLMGYIRKYYALVLAHDDSTRRIAAIKSMQKSLPKKDKALIAKYKLDQGTLSLDMAAKPFLPALLKSDPPKDWRRVNAAVLILGGGKDHQVPAKENVAGILAALKAGGNRSVESAILPSLNHLFQTAATGKEDEYGSIEETIAPEVLARVAAFASKQR